MLIIEEHEKENSCDIAIIEGDTFTSFQIAVPLISSLQAREEFLLQYFRKESRW